MPYDFEIVDQRQKAPRNSLLRLIQTDRGFTLSVNSKIVIDATKITDSGTFYIHRKASHYDDGVYKFDVE